MRRPFQEGASMHDVIIVAVPLIAILAGILLNRSDIKELRSDVRGDIASLRSETLGRLDRIVADLRQFYSVSGKLEGRIDEVFKR